MYKTIDRPVKGERIRLQGVPQTRTFVVLAVATLRDGVTCVVRVGRTKELVKYVGEPECNHTDLPVVDVRSGRPHLEEMPTEEAIVHYCETCDRYTPLTPAEWCGYWLGDFPNV